MYTAILFMPVSFNETKYANTFCLVAYSGINYGSFCQKWEADVNFVFRVQATLIYIVFSFLISYYKCQRLHRTSLEENVEQMNLAELAMAKQHLGKGQQKMV